MATYKEYVSDCIAEGVEPDPMPKWRSEQARAAKELTDPVPRAEGALSAEAEDAARADVIAEAKQAEAAKAAADAVADAAREPEPVAVKLPDHPMFFHPGRYHVEVVKSGIHVYPDGHTQKIHSIIEFMEHHWTPDMSDAEDKAKAEWLVNSKSFKRGETVLVAQHQSVGNVAVKDGPRTASVSTPRVIRPQGELSAKL